MKFSKFLTTFIFTLTFLLPPSSILAQKPVDLGSDLQGVGPYGSGLGSTGAANSQFEKILSSVVGAMTVGAGIWFTFQIVMGGITWIGAAGDKTALQASRSRITSAILGLVITVSSLVIIALIGGMLGFDILNLNISKLVP